MKKLLILIIFIFIGFNSEVLAQNDTDIILDPKCNTYQIIQRDDQLSPLCNSFCVYSCLKAGKHCVFESTTDCPFSDSDLYNYYVGAREDTSNTFNIFGVELCPSPDIRPDDDPYCLINLVRLGFYAVISLLIFILVLMALWVVWVRSTAADNPEKVEKAASIARNAVIGALITFLFIGIVQVVSLIVGLSGNIFEISIVPQPRGVPRGDSCEGYTYCIESQDSCVLDPNVGYKKCM